MASEDPMDMPAAEKAIRYGSNLGFFVAFVLALGVVLAGTTNLGDALDQWNDPWILADAAFVAALALGVRRRSRTCAIGLTGYYVISAVCRYVEEGRVSGVLMVAIFTYYFAKSIGGTVVYHKIRRDQDPEYRSVSKWTYWLLIPSAVVTVLLFTFTIAGMFMLPVNVIGGDEMNPRHTALLRERGVLFEDEKVINFYSAALFSILSDGNMITDRRVVSYETINGELFIHDAAHEDVAGFTVISQGGFWEDTIIGIQTTSDESFILLASPEGDGDKRFLSDLESRIGQMGDTSSL
jgi:hypothetical protein